MALNVQTFKTRTLTAAVFVVIMLLGLFLGHWSFFILFSIIHFGCWIEYQKLVGLIDNDYQQISAFHKYGVMIAGWCIMLSFTNDAFLIGGLHLHSLGFWLGLILVFLLPVMELLFAKEVKPKNIAYSAAGLIYLSLSWALMIDLRVSGIFFFEGPSGSGFSDNGFIIPAGLVFSIWINDTMAYIVGSLIGKTPFSSISPKKTWEGTLGGAILCVLVVTFTGSFIGGFHFIHWMMIALIAAVAGTAGDLLQSKLKRMAAVKDSGSIMPGHGGFLDRFDSLLLAVPFVWLYVQLFIDNKPY
jgi:phosphatidate cytidylyltransferase